MAKPEDSRTEPDEAEKDKLDRANVSSGNGRKGLRPLTEDEMKMVAGGVDTDPEGPTGPPITVTANPPTTSNPPVTVTGNPPVTVTENPPVTGAPPSTGGVPPPPPPPSMSRKVADYPRRCTSPAGVATDVSRYVRGAGTGGPPNPITDPEGHDWTQVEFEAVITGTINTYGVVNAGIYSNDQAGFAAAPTDSQSVGVWHNHPSTGRSPAQRLDDRYPSTNSEGNDDWQSLQAFADKVAPNDPSFNPSFFVTDSEGVVREFKLSDRSSIEGLTAQQRQQGVGLDGRDRSSVPCA